MQQWLLVSDLVLACLQDKVKYVIRTHFYKAKALKCDKSLSYIPLRLAVSSWQTFLKT